MKILGIETSCDETAVAVVENGSVILSNVVASQIDIHVRYGGIVPEVASRQHLIALLPVLKRALAEAKITGHELSGIAVTFGPGLPGSLLVGVNIAKSLSFAWKLPLTGVNHLEGHIYANWLDKEEELPFPSLCLVVSGGHTELVLMIGHGQYQRLGRTRDDAAGEAFDKAARILGLGYPGGPAIERASERGKATFPLPRAWLKGSDDFSFSGLKTSLLHLVQNRNILGNSSLVAEAASSFQEAVVDVLVTKTVAAGLRLGAKQILISGGVAANKLLRRQFAEKSSLPVFMPDPSLCTDNAAMVAVCGYYHFQIGKVDGFELDVMPSLSLP